MTLRVRVPAPRGLPTNQRISMKHRIEHAVTKIKPGSPEPLGIIVAMLMLFGIIIAVVVTTISLL